MKQLPKGLWPVILTPFQENNELDLVGLKPLTEFYIAGGANGLFANCLSSEMFQLTNQERLKLTKKVVDTVNGRVPVISTGSFGNDVDATAEFVKMLYDTGVTAVVISTSQLCNELESDDAFKIKIETLLAKTGEIPLGLYECPVPYKRLIAPELFGWLGQTGRFLYHKDTCCTLKEIKKKIKRVDGTPLGVYNAHTQTGLASLKAGARGLSPIAANLYPELFTYLISHQSQPEKLEKLDAMLTIMEAVVDHNYPYTAKLFLKKRGLKIQANCRVPVSPISDQEHIQLDAIMTIFRQFAEELDIEIIRF